MSNDTNQNSKADGEEDVIQGKSSRAAAPRAPRASGGAAARGGEEERVWITIQKTDKEFRDVFVGHNFKSYRVKRGVPVLVPLGVVAALELAIGTKLVPEEDPITRRVVPVAQESMSYPFQYARRPASAME